MADEYIKREDAIARSYRFYWRSGSLSNPVVSVKNLKDIPAADVAPVVHGTNIGEDYDDCDQFVCSNCGIELQDWTRVERDLDDGEITHHEYTFRYCPNCGAKMDGGDTNG